jgi:hypothetical protein
MPACFGKVKGDGTDSEKFGIQETQQTSRISGPRKKKARPW